MYVVLEALLKSLSQCKSFSVHPPSVGDLGFVSQSVEPACCVFFNNFSLVKVGMLGFLIC